MDVATRAEDPVDGSTVERLSAASNRCFEALALEDDVSSEDASCDLVPPFWRFQLVGPDAFRPAPSHLLGPSTVRVLRTVRTADGFATEHDETVRGSRVEAARRLWLCAVRDGSTTEAVGYGNGGWDDEL